MKYEVKEEREKERETEYPLWATPSTPITWPNSIEQSWRSTKEKEKGGWKMTSVNGGGRSSTINMIYLPRSSLTDIFKTVRDIIHLLICFHSLRLSGMKNCFYLTGKSIEKYLRFMLSGLDSFQDCGNTGKVKCRVCNTILSSAIKIEMGFRKMF